MGLVWKFSQSWLLLIDKIITIWILNVLFEFSRGYCKSILRQQKSVQKVAIQDLFLEGPVKIIV